MTPGDDRTDAELEAAAKAYLWMLQQEADGKPFSKAEVNQSLRNGVLASRSKASIEYRMQNTSAVLEEIGEARIGGYLPAKNVGEGVKARIRRAVEASGFRLSPDYEPTADPVELERRVARLRKKKTPSIPPGRAAPASVSTTGRSFVRDPAVKAWVLHTANGLCEACGAPAPFTGDDGEPFLEVHHFRQLADGGSDRVSNAVALCPNCHRRCHHGQDRHEFTDGLYGRLPRLVQE